MSQRKLKEGLDTVAHAYNSSAGGGEVGRDSLGHITSSRQPGLHSKTLSQKRRKGGGREEGRRRERGRKGGGREERGRGDRGREGGSLKEGNNKHKNNVTENRHAIWKR
jgi:hypothetical protein